MNTFLNGMKNETNYTLTENGALTHKTTTSDLLDMFALGASMRKRSDEDVLLMFQKAYRENPLYALKCLFYIRDVRGGQGERRFFRVCMKWLANNESEVVIRNLKNVPEFGRWDDLYVFDGTAIEDEAYTLIKEQLALDVQCKTPSLLAKWLKSENTSSAKSQYLGMKTRKHLNMTPRQYRKTLSILRKRINVLERLMSTGEWDKIEFDKIPSRAGLIYKNAFARHDIERQKAGARTYENFAKDETTTVNAKALYPYECVAKAMNLMGYGGYGWYGYDHAIPMDNTDRLMINKYWANLADYFAGKTFNGMALVDTSGSMTGSEASAPINVAISIGMYCADKAKGPFANHFMTFESTPHFMEVEGVDFCDKVKRISYAPWGGSTNVESAFDLMLKTAIKNGCSQDEIPENLIIISDMEFNSCVRCGSYGTVGNTLMEKIEKEWNAYGYNCPKIIFWNVDARQNNIPMTVKNGISFVSGFSPSIFEQILSGKTAMDLMYEVLNKERYACIK